MISIKNASPASATRARLALKQSALIGGIVMLIETASVASAKNAFFLTLHHVPAASAVNHRLLTRDHAPVASAWASMPVLKDATATTSANPACTATKTVSAGPFSAVVLVA